MKSFKKFFISALLVTSTISLTSCKWIRGIMSFLNEDDDVSEVSRSEPKPHEAVQSTVGRSGGVIKDEEDNIKISIPEGALSEDTNISAKYVEEPSFINNQIQTGFLGAVEFGPSGTTFNKPVEVSIQLIEEPNNSSLSVFCYNETEMLWEYVTEASVVNVSIAKFEVTHFSTYQVVNRTSDFYNEYQNIVRHAKVNGLSDTEIIEAFRDYLVNNKHIMDYYEKFNGYWYEPCGLKLSGKYQINGQSGDLEKLYLSEGESNKVGDTYGMCKIDGATSSQQDYKNRSSSSEAFDILVLVEYKLIKPDIELSASKKKLKKGETATISIRCHYTNVANHFEQFKDIEMSNYMLTIAKPTHFSTDKSVVLTNGSGRASFIVTALESNKAETITVNFDVSGPFGVHAEGNITLNSEGTTFEGRIEETYYITYEPNTMGLYSPEISQVGSLSMTISYDFSGVIEDKEGDLVGSVEIKNVDVSLESEQLLYIVDNNSTPYSYGDYYVDMFKNKNPLVSSNASIDCVVSQESDGSVSLLGTSFEDIANQTGNVETIAYMVIPSEGYRDEIAYEDFDFEINISTGSTVLLPFELVKGTQTYNESSLVDEVEIYFGGESLDDYRGCSFSTPVTKTTQIITVA